MHTKYRWHRAKGISNIDRANAEWPVSLFIYLPFQFSIFCILCQRSLWANKPMRRQSLAKVAKCKRTFQYVETQQNQIDSNFHYERGENLRTKDNHWTSAAVQPTNSMQQKELARIFFVLCDLHSNNECLSNTKDYMSVYSFAFCIKINIKNRAWQERE